jgi:amino acid transporter
MNLAITGVIPWQEAMHSDYLVSRFIEKLYGTGAADVATMLILWIAFASLFSIILGYSRVPYAAAADGRFFLIFARLHPTKQFPYVSLLFIAGMGFLFSLFFRLSDAINAILAMRILVQFIAQAVGVVRLRRRNGFRHLPFRMWLYPVPVALSVGVWLFVLFSTGWVALFGILLVLIGVLVFYLTRNWWRPGRLSANGA